MMKVLSVFILISLALIVNSMPLDESGRSGDIEAVHVDKGTNPNRGEITTFLILIKDVLLEKIFGDDPHKEHDHEKNAAMAIKSSSSILALLSSIILAINL